MQLSSKKLQKETLYNIQLSPLTFLGKLTKFLTTIVKMRSSIHFFLKKQFTSFDH